MSDPMQSPDRRSDDIILDEDYILGPTPNSNHDAISHLSKEVAALQQTDQEVTRLRRKVLGLTTALIAMALIGGGILAGIVLGFRDQQLALKDEQSRLSDQVEALERDRASAEQISRLEEQLVALNQRTQILGEQARALAEQLPNLTADQVSELQQRIQELEQGIRENVSGESATRRLDQLTGVIQRILKRDESQLEQAPDSPTSPDAAPEN
ncbi:MAG: hypothetical protein WBA10_16055 [Elainellaceae cyanobacterium]